MVLHWLLGWWKEHLFVNRNMYKCSLNMTVYVWHPAYLLIQPSVTAEQWFMLLYLFNVQIMCGPSTLTLSEITVCIVCLQEIGALFVCSCMQILQVLFVCRAVPVLCKSVCCESLKKASKATCALLLTSQHWDQTVLRIISGHGLQCLFKITPLKLRMFTQTMPVGCSTLPLTGNCKENRAFLLISGRRNVETKYYWNVSVLFHNCVWAVLFFLFSSHLNTRCL